MSIRELKKEARKNLKSNNENIGVVSLIYLAAAFLAVYLSASSIPYIFYGIWLCCFAFMGPIDIGKAGVSLELCRIKSGCSADVFRYFDNEAYRRRKWAYFRKYAAVSFFFFGFCCCLVLIVSWIFSDLGANEFKTVAENGIVLGVGGESKHYSYFAPVIFMIFSLIMFVLVLAKYVFVECVFADECEKSANDRTFTTDDLTERVLDINNRFLDYNYLKIVKLILSFWLDFLFSVITCGLGFILLIPYFDETVAVVYTEEKNKYEGFYDEITI